MNNICLITPGHISSNPRLVKEATLLSELNYKVHVIFTQNLSFLVESDYEVLRENPSWTYDILDNTKSSFRKYYSILLSKLSAFLMLCFLTDILGRLSINRNYFWQYRKALNVKADLYIAHNLGALPIAVNASKKNKVKCGFDAEDFHRQETTDDQKEISFYLAKFIEDKYLMMLDYFTVASPLISIAYQKINSKLNPQLINNAFSIKHLQTIKSSDENELSLFWFSQTIGKGRGIEHAIEAIGLLKKLNISLSLLGNITIADKNYFLDLAKKCGFRKEQLHFIAPISANLIFEMASRYDIGLALEEIKPYNRNICLTNKIFTYLTAGNAIIASETLAQKQFIDKYPEIGKSFPVGDIKMLAARIKEYYDNRGLLTQAKFSAYNYAKKSLNWENESKRFLSVLDKTLNN